MNSATAMRNAILYIDRKDVNLPECSFFLADVMGMEVRDAKTGRSWETSPMCSPSPQQRLCGQGGAWEIPDPRGG